MGDINQQPMADAISGGLRKTKLRKYEAGMTSVLAQMRAEYELSGFGYESDKTPIGHTDYKCEQCGGLQRVRDDYQGALRCSTCGGLLTKLTILCLQEALFELDNGQETNDDLLSLENARLEVSIAQRNLVVARKSKDITKAQKQLNDATDGLKIIECNIVTTEENNTIKDEF